jgi:2-keto-3-deoxy-galactonokinase
MNPDAGMFCADMGTTRTRVWVVERDRIWSRVIGDFGARDVASGRSREWLASELNSLIERAATQAQQSGFSGMPEVIAASGMITCEHGIHEVAHSSAPVEPAELAHHLVAVPFLGRPNLSLFLVPGIRTGSLSGSVQEILQSDLIRGEETLCVGLLETGILGPDCALLNLGSHWKWVEIGSRGEIAGSFTALTGELIHMLHSNTLIASALPDSPPTELNAHWVQLGYLEARSSGLGRVAFAIRLLGLSGINTTEERASFLYGAFISDEIEHLQSRVSDAREVVVCGPPSLATCWARCLEKKGVACTVLDDITRERCYLEGLKTLLRMHLESVGYGC